MSWHRIDLYRVKTGKTLAEVASDLGVGVSMLMMVKTGKRALSRKVIYRLEQAEADAGIKRLEGVAEDSGQYTTRAQNAEIRRDLRGMKKDLAALDKRVDEMLDKLDKGRSGR